MYHKVALDEKLPHSAASFYDYEVWIDTLPNGRIRGVQVRGEKKGRGSLMLGWSFLPLAEEKFWAYVARSAITMLADGISEQLNSSTNA